MTSRTVTLPTERGRSKTGSITYNVYLQSENMPNLVGKIPNRILQKLKPLNDKESPGKTKTKLADKLAQANQRRQTYLEEKRKRAKRTSHRKPLSSITLQQVQEKQWKADIRRQMHEDEKILRAAELGQSIWFSPSRNDPQLAKALLEEKLKRAELRRKMVEKERLERIRKCEERTKDIVTRMQPFIQQAATLERQRHLWLCSSDV
eukprot:m.311110 g.311110  ORF g.311110 m.311110 type:complete len:206 (+) comp59893_c0_seq1:348-965(+)